MRTLTIHQTNDYIQQWKKISSQSKKKINEISAKEKWWRKKKWRTSEYLTKESGKALTSMDLSFDDM